MREKVNRDKLVLKTGEAKEMSEGWKAHKKTIKQHCNRRPDIRKGEETD